VRRKQESKRGNGINIAVVYSFEPEAPTSPLLSVNKDFVIVGIRRPPDSDGELLPSTPSTYHNRAKTDCRRWFQSLLRQWPSAERAHSADSADRHMVYKVQPQ